LNAATASMVEMELVCTLCTHT